eukprot:TRINITY_DN5084_c0_g1_i1.p1 TRINITY_DN5084_c0_g1~~TRINITY_DN5084_c0_g1_i1.p1  ORF type:complete len:111 (+),score=36.54 TRINITY_DN5084_c0_g1_i1:122-454(+)
MSSISLLRMGMKRGNALPNRQTSMKITPLTKNKRFVSQANSSKMASDDFAGEADGRNFGNEPTKDIPKGTSPKNFFTDGNDSQIPQKEKNPRKDDAKHNSMPGTDAKDKK